MNEPINELAHEKYLEAADSILKEITEGLTKVNCAECCPLRGMGECDNCDYGASLTEGIEQQYDQTIKQIKGE